MMKLGYNPQHDKTAFQLVVQTKENIGHADIRSDFDGCSTPLNMYMHVSHDYVNFSLIRTQKVLSADCGGSDK